MPTSQDNRYIDEKRLRQGAFQEGNGNRDNDRILKIRLSNYLRRLKKIVGATAVSVALLVGAGIGVGSYAVDHIHDSYIVSQYASEFRKDCINPETHRTNDNQHYFYDYSDIADYCEEMGDFDLGIYLFYKNTNAYQTGRVLDYTPYDSLDAYLAAHHWVDPDDWEKDMNRKIVLSYENNKNLEELQKMAFEHQTGKDGETVIANPGDLQQNPDGTYGGGQK